jgi:patched 1 protein
VPVPPAQPLIYAQIPFFLSNLTNTPPIVDMIKVMAWLSLNFNVIGIFQRIRNISEAYTHQQLYTFPQGIPFTFWEQYLSLRRELLSALSITVAVVFIVVSVSTMNPWTGAMVTGMVVMIVVELGGVMGSAGTALCA